MAYPLYEIVEEDTPNTLEARVVDKRWFGRSDSDDEWELILRVFEGMWGENKLSHLGRAFVCASIFYGVVEDDKLFVCLV